MKHRLGWLLFVGGVTSAGLLIIGGQDAKPVIAQSADEGCPESSPATTQTGTVLETFATNSNSGVVYDPGGAALEVQKAGGLFLNANFGLASDAHGVCTADFDNDGWIDIMSTSYNGGEILLSLNKTLDNQLPPFPAPDWANPAYFTTPKFIAGHYISQGCSGQNGHASPAQCGNNGNEALGCADYNNDGNADFMFVRENNNNNGVPHAATMYLGNGNGTFQPGYQAGTASEFKYINKSTTMLSVDYNGDGFLDLLIGGSSVYNVSNRGHVQLFLSDGAASPNFVQSTPLVTNEVMGSKGINTLTYADFTGDTFEDLVVTSTKGGIGMVHLYPGLSGGGIQPTFLPIAASYPGAAAMVLGADFSLDGKPDLMFASDDYGTPGGIGGFTHYYTNNGNATTPFSGGITQTLTTRNNPFSDFDMAAVFQYDNDPDGTPDFVVANGNGAGAFQIFANRAIGQYNTCGDVQSGVLGLGALAGEEMVITAARISPTLSMPAGTSITFYMSNESPENWVVASPCIDDANDYCVSFPKPVGQDVKWKATMCSNAARTLSPEISGMDVTFDYTEAEEHYRAGVVVDDGIAYVGAFRQPGDRGHFYALNAGLDQTYWDFADSLNTVSDATRKVYTSNTAGNALVDFTFANASTVKSTLGVVSTTQAENIITWQRGPRFGVDGLSRLGSVESSTPAVVGPPALPNWYARADSTDKAKMDTFITQHNARDKLVLVGSKDGALHAIYSNSTNAFAAPSGTEAWAYVPPKIAASMVADHTDSIAANKTIISAYPDGSPTVADVIFNDGTVHTVAVVAGGNGHRSVFAIDITETVDEITGVVVGPTPMWDLIPGGAFAGQANSKPVIARVKIAGTPKFIAIIATGVASDNPIAPFSKGRDVIAVDVTTGAIIWQFQAKCAISSDITAFETNDSGEVGPPVIDGYIDRAVFADTCGYVYKVDPGQNVGTGYITGIGTVATGHTDPAAQAVDALFYTGSTACAIGAERPIAGTIGARPDGNSTENRIALFFGTGGVENFDPSKPNHFYAVHADTGLVRGCSAIPAAPAEGRIIGSCTGTAPNQVCEKFYGGVVVTTSNIIVTSSVDPAIGTGTCEIGTSDIRGLATADFAVNFSQAITGGSSVSSLYGAGDALYFATLSGDIVRLGTPRATNAGDDTVSGDTGTSVPDTDGTAISNPGNGMWLRGWNMLQ